MIFGAIHAEVNWRIFFSPTGLPSTISYRHPVIELLTERPLQPLHTSVGLPTIYVLGLTKIVAHLHRIRRRGSME
jgi:hypothetical protein